MATISSAGVGSGLDVESIITKLMAIERQPITQLQTQEKTLQTQLSSYGKVLSSLADLKEAAAQLADADTWSPTTATSSDAASVTGIAGTSTTPARYQVSVSKLAAAQTLAGGKTYAATTDVVGQGTLHIELGTWNADQTAFTPKAGATAVDVVVAPGSDSLQAVRDAINGANAGVTASIVTDSNGARLVLRSTQTGAENGFRIGVTDADGNAADGAGLSALAYDPAAGIASMSRTQAAASASATINGVPVVSSSNELSGVIDGLTLKLTRETTAPVEVNVVRDDDAIRKSLDGFVSAYNSLTKLLKDQTHADATGKTAGALAGDSTALGLLSAVRSMVGAASGASTAFDRLSAVGLQVQTDGSLKVDATRLDAAFGQVDQLSRLFTNSDAGNAANDGFGVRFEKFATGMLGLTGALKTRSDGLQTRIDANEDRQAALQDRASLTEKRLRAQYTALDQVMAQMQSQQQYVTQMITAMAAAAKS